MMTVPKVLHLRLLIGRLKKWRQGIRGGVRRMSDIGQAKEPLQSSSTSKSGTGSVNLSHHAPRSS